MPSPKPTRLIAIAECGLFALIAGSTLVWAKMALAYLGPLTISSLRYCLAFGLMLPFLIHCNRHRRIPQQLWLHFSLIAVSLYGIGNGALYWGLQYLPATTASLLLSFIPVLVMIAGIIWLGEYPTGWQVLGVIVAVGGGVLFFAPGLVAGELLGIVIVVLGLLGNAAFGILNRALARIDVVDTLTLTALPLAIGGVILLPVALWIEGLPQFSLIAFALILGLAAVNTVGAYLLYNHALRVLPSFEQSALLNLTPLVTAVWAWLLLGERLVSKQIIGMLVVLSGVISIQLGRKRVRL